MLGLALAPTGLATAATDTRAAARPGELVVGFDDEVGASRRSALRRALGLRRIRALRPGARADLVAVEERSTPELTARARAIGDTPGVAYAEPNWLIRTDRLPSDYFFLTRQWALRNTGSFLVGNPGDPVPSTAGTDIDAPRAWDMTTGSRGVVIGVVDTGLYSAHLELDGQAWANPGERLNGIDDDGNGIADDLRGWDFVEFDGDPADHDGHGTHVAGIAGAEADGRGTVGVTWNARIMPVRALAGGGEPSDAATVADGLRYAAGEGAHVVTMSFGAPAESQAITSAIADHPRTLFVASAGNTGFNNDFLFWFPCNADPSNIICVASSDHHDEKALDSSYGASTVDLAAPGTLIVGPNGDPSTRTPDSYVSRSGTSLAVPHVAGAVALIRSLEPWHGVQAQKGCILDGVDAVPALTDYVASGGRLNARRALEACADRAAPEVAPAQIAPIDGSLVRPDSLSFRITSGRDRHSGVASNTILLDGRPVASGGPALTTLTPRARVADGRHSWAVRSTDRFGHIRDSGTRSLVVDGTPPTLGLRIRRRSAARGITAKATPSESVTVRAATLRLSRNAARRIGTRRRTLRCRATNWLPSGTQTLSIKLPRAVRRRGAGQKVSFRLALADDAGNVASKRFSVKLR